MKTRTLIALGSVPKDGGTFTFYRNLRPALLKHNIELRCVTVGQSESSLVEDGYIDDGCVILAPTCRSIKKQARAFVEWCEKESVDIAIGLNSEAILSSIPHLPAKVRVVARCANAFDHGYRITLSGASRLEKIVALTPRLKDDLVNGYGASTDLIRQIPNGIDPVPFNRAAANQRGKAPVLQLGFVGRLEHKQKGVLYIPEIVRILDELGVNYHLSIAGKGVHRQQLESALSDGVRSKKVEFLGSISHSDVPKFLERIDVFLFTSHFEGCPNALLEAMMAGCVPVAWLIEGITDFIVSNGNTGFICPMGDTNSFAQQIAELAGDRDLVRECGVNAARAARDRFTHEVSAAAYAKLFREVMAAPRRDWMPLPWGSFKGDPNFVHSWRDWIPVRIKRLIKSQLQNMPISKINSSIPPS